MDIEEICKREHWRLAAKIDKSISIVLLPKPWWCPEWLYYKIIRKSISIIYMNDR